MGENPMELPKVVATMTLKLHEDGNMTFEFSGTLADSRVAEHMLRKGAQAIDDEQFQVYLKFRQENEALVKSAGPGALNGIDVRGKRNHG